MEPNQIMERTIKIDEIVNQIGEMDYNDKINIMSRIVGLLKHEKKNNRLYSITQLKGLGKDIWQKTDIPTYVESERESWD